MCTAEQNATLLVSQLMESAASARHTEELMEAMERERLEEEKWWLVRAEEVQQLRRKEVLAAMQQILSENEMMGQLIGNYVSDRERTGREAQAK